MWDVIIYFVSLGLDFQQRWSEGNLGGMFHPGHMNSHPSIDAIRVTQILLLHIYIMFV
jgi:hypothetical protein